MAQRRTVIITRPRAQAQSLADAIRGLGAQAVIAPAIRVAAPSSWRRLDAALRRLDAYDVVVFTSANGVDRFFVRARRVLGGPPRLPRRLFAIGPATAAALRRRGWRGASVPDRYEGEALARHLLRQVGGVRGKRVLLPRARVARDVLPRLLARAGARVDVVESYRTVADRAGRRRLARAAAEGGSPIVTFTSPSTVHEFVAAVGLRKARRFFRSAAAASIGPITSQALRGYGIAPAAQAQPYTVAGLARAVARLLPL
ncbi:MAG: uroporphyrinogen-III synthase [Elusimicrobia bacterium]|nr:uroporphyrinogen-III synthase [Elusimicrobiota bacterium]